LDLIHIGNIIPTYIDVNRIHGYEVYRRSENIIRGYSGISRKYRNIIEKASFRTLLTK